MEIVTEEMADQEKADMATTEDSPDMKPEELV